MFDIVKSIVLYLGVFGLSLTLFATSESQLELRDAKAKSKNKIRTCKAAFPHLCAILAILILCFLAAFRADSVGVDTAVYPDSFLRLAHSYSNFPAFLADQNGPSDEPLGALLVWLCSRITTEKALLLFWYQFFTVVPTYIALYKLRDRVSITVGMAVYLFFFFNNSLNMMRQSIACAFLLLAFAFLMRDRHLNFSFIIFSIVAILFHNSGIYGFVLLSGASLVGLLRKRALRVLLYLAIILSPLYLGQIAQALVANGVGGDQMRTYVEIFIYHTFDKDWFVNPFSIVSIGYLAVYSWLVFLPRLLEVFFAAKGNGNRISLDGSNSWLWGYLRTLNTTGYLLYIVLLFSMQTMYGIRFSIYYDFMLIIALGLSCKDKPYRRARKLFVLISLLLAWFIWTVILGWSGSQIYLFFFE